jgi:acetyl-CoA carboxylase biotin carboxyl carrier protein
MNKKPSVMKTGPSLNPQTNSDVPEGVIRKLSEILRSTDLAEIEFSTAQMTVRVRAREAMGTVMVSGGAPAIAASGPVATAKPQVEAQSDLHMIRSPFVGTFYRAPSPNSANFIEMNQTISKGQPLCIVEAMKLMNEIEADISGTIEKIFVENGQPVEFNTPLFGIRKS